MKEQSKSTGKEETRPTKHQEHKALARVRKVTLTEESLKRYKVTVIYVPVSEEEARIKRAIIESIMRKPSKK